VPRRTWGPSHACCSRASEPTGRARTTKASGDAIAGRSSETDFLGSGDDAVEPAAPGYLLQTIELFMYWNQLC